MQAPQTRPSYPYTGCRVEGKGADRKKGQSGNKRTYSGTGVERMQAPCTNQTFFPYTEGRIVGKGADRIKGQSRNKRTYSGTGVERVPAPLNRPCSPYTGCRAEDSMKSEVKIKGQSRNKSNILKDRVGEDASTTNQTILPLHWVQG